MLTTIRRAAPVITILFFLSLGGSSLIQNQGRDTQATENESKLKEMIRAVNSDLPREVEPGMILDRVELNGKEVEYLFILSEMNGAASVTEDLRVEIENRVRGQAAGNEGVSWLAREFNVTVRFAFYTADRFPITVMKIPAPGV